ncbi:MAG TPA: class I SAM-dependent methyltransferase, partial [Terriglobales bacterium]|nr:class I SAM-dependent methyltransferase [Terriglobales bacterium]
MIRIDKRIGLFRWLPNGSQVVEIGSWRGYFAVELLELKNLKHVTLVDAWENIDEEHNESAMKECLSNIRGHVPGGRVSVIRKRSLDAVQNFKDKSLEAVYIDAAHDYENVLADLRAWSKKVKRYGFIFGHDFVQNDALNFGVIEAVHEFCKESNWRLHALTSEEFPSFALRYIEPIPKIIHQFWEGMMPEKIR